MAEKKQFELKYRSNLDPDNVYSVIETCYTRIQAERNLVLRLGDEPGFELLGVENISTPKYYIAQIRKILGGNTHD